MHRRSKWWMKNLEQTEYKKQKWKRNCGWQRSADAAPIFHLANISCSTFCCRFFVQFDCIDGMLFGACNKQMGACVFIPFYANENDGGAKQKGKRKMKNENYVQWDYNRHNYLAPFARASYTISRNENEKRRSREMQRTNIQRVPWLKKTNTFVSKRQRTGKKSIETKQLRINR